jgi:hypothetical protein
MTKNEIREIHVQVKSNGEFALALMACADGSLRRQGSGQVPQTQPVVMGMTDGRYFREIMSHVNEGAFPHAGVYDYPDKAGLPIEYLLVLSGAQAKDGDRPTVGFRVSLGTETKGVDTLVKYLDAFATKAVEITKPWYEAALAGKRGPEIPGGV